jgi:MFS family permease
MLSRYLLGAAAARMAEETSVPALLLLGLTVTGSAGTASVLLAGLTGASAFGGPIFGTLLDRARHPGRLQAAALAGYAVGLAALLAAVGHLPTAAAFALALMAGLFNPAVAGGWTAQLPHVLDGRELSRATALDALTFNVAALTGPAVAALTADRFGAGVAVAAAAGLVVLALPSAWTLPGQVPGAHPLNWTAGFAAISANRALLRATATSTVSYVGVGMLVVSWPLLGEDRLGAAAWGTLLLAVLAAASLVTNAVLAQRPWRGRPDTLILVSTLVLSASAVLAAIPGPPLVLTAMVSGTAEGPQLTALFAVRHREAPEQLRAQVFTTGASLKVTGFAAGSALAGQLAAASLTACLITAAALQLLAALVYSAVRTPSPARAA